VDRYTQFAASLFRPSLLSTRGDLLRATAPRTFSSLPDGSPLVPLRLRIMRDFSSLPNGLHRRKITLLQGDRFGTTRVPGETTHLPAATSPKNLPQLEEKAGTGLLFYSCVLSYTEGVCTEQLVADRDGRDRLTSTQWAQLLVVGYLPARPGKVSVWTSILPSSHLCARYADGRQESNDDAGGVTLHFHLLSTRVSALLIVNNQDGCSPCRGIAPSGKARER